jgi:2-keto-4-pentenoate hydratase/2-oxohepta-3-ene-1,7-dioic acid hydratase in catechol pathway
MKLRRVRKDPRAVVQVHGGRGWVALANVLARLSLQPGLADAARWSTDLVAFLGAPASIRVAVEQLAAEMPADALSEPTVLIPFEPRSYRDFMLYERHAVDAARGFVRTFWPRLSPIVAAYEAVTRRAFPALRPKPLWYREPIYYMGNHLAFATDGDAIPIPSYTRALDYELEIGLVLAQGLLDATPAEAEAAIGGFVVFNDFSARDVQHAEMQSGFGPQKSKHFHNAISSTVVTADEILPHWRSLEGFVRINGELIGTPTSAGPRWSLGEAIAHASRSERLYPGEFFGSGTLPGGSGIETGRLLEAGDCIEIGIDRIGSLANRIISNAEVRRGSTRPDDEERS